MMSVNCGGSIVLGSSCGDCERCIERSKLIVNRYKSIPLKELKPRAQFELQASVTYLQRHLGIKGFQKFVGKRELL